MSREFYDRYGNLLNEYRPTIRSIIFKILFSKFIEKNIHKKNILENSSSEIKYLAPENLVYLAIIKNNTIQEMIRVNESTAKMLLDKNYILVEYDPNNKNIQKGNIYNDLESNENEKN